MEFKRAVSRSVFYLAFILLLALVAGCSSSLKATPAEGFAPETAEKIKLIDTCENITCGENERCESGECICADNFKQCGESCIPKDSCCTNDDCSGEDICLQNQCVFDCSVVECKSNQVCDPGQERCLCPSGFKWCDKQEACIPEDNCCSNFDCGSEEMCVNTYRSAEICFTHQTRSCKYLYQNQEKIISLGDMDFQVEIVEFDYEEKIRLKINGDEYDLRKQDSLFFDKIRMNINNVKTLGGRCKDK